MMYEEIHNIIYGKSKIAKSSADTVVFLSTILSILSMLEIIEINSDELIEEHYLSKIFDSIMKEAAIINEKYNSENQYLHGKML